MDKSRDTRKLRVKVKDENGDAKEITATGRVLWALEQLAEGPRTPITRPAPRWSDYVFRLRNEGVNIETDTVPHDGPYPGTHAQYHLRSTITFLGEVSK